MTVTNQENAKQSTATLASNSSVIRVVTAGSVDNGKSTLIGRLLYDSKKILQDHLENIEAAKERYGNENINLAFLTDGLRAEREQGITIDVAYRYFTSDKRKYILADCPGHIQYTKNMFTGASTANAAIILVDAQAGFNEQSRRHTYLSLLLGVSNIIFAINKMDLLAYSEETYSKIKSDIENWLPEDTNSSYHYIPISALEGDNIVHKSTNMDWYTGESMMDLMDQLPVNVRKTAGSFRYPVQWVVRPQANEYHDYRGYAGTVASGILKVGDEVRVQPTGLSSKVKQIQIGGEDVDEVGPDLSPTILLEDDIDISRGSVIHAADSEMKSDNRFGATITWLNSNAAQTGKRYWMKHTTRWVKVMIEDLSEKLDLETLEFNNSGDNKLDLNGIAKVNIVASEPIFFDSYRDNKTTGSFILADETSFETVGAGMIA